MAIIISTANAKVNKKVLDTFLILAVENMFGDDEVIFQNDSAS